MLTIAVGCSRLNTEVKPKVDITDFNDTENLVLLIADNQEVLLLSDPIFEQSKLSERAK